MGADEHLNGQQFQQVHRGLYLGDPDTPKTAQLLGRMKDDPRAALRATGKGAVGVHWTDDEPTADRFARQHWRDSYVGVTLHGEVSPEHVVQPGTPEHLAYGRTHAVLNPATSDEHEVTVRAGGQIRVTGVTVHHNGNSWRHDIQKDVMA